MTVEPLYDRVLLKRRDAPTTTRSGLFLPPTKDEKNLYCTVVAAGPGARVEPPPTATHPTAGYLYLMRVQAGDTVLIGKWAGDEVQIEEVPHLIVRESEILAVVRG